MRAALFALLAGGCGRLSPLPPIPYTESASLSVLTEDGLDCVWSHWAEDVGETILARIPGECRLVRAQLSPSGDLALVRSLARPWTPGWIADFNRGGARFELPRKRSDALIVDTGFDPAGDPLVFAFEQYEVRGLSRYWRRWNEELSVDNQQARYRWVRDTWRREPLAIDFDTAASAELDPAHETRILGTLQIETRGSDRSVRLVDTELDEVLFIRPYARATFWPD